MNLRNSTAPGKRCGRQGFTFVELMVSMAVLSLLIVMLAQIFSTTVLATNGSQKKLEATRQARAVLDTIREDIENAVTKNGAATVFALDDSNKNSQLVFVTYRRGPQGAATGPRFMSISYTLNSTQNQVTRNYNLIPWSSADLVTNAFASLSTPLSSQAVAEGMLRFQVMALLDNGAVEPLPTAGAISTSWMTNTWNGTTVPNGFFALQLAGTTADPANPKVRALTVAVAAVDGKSLRLPNVGNISAALISSTAGVTPLEKWDGVINAGGLSAYPRPAVSALRVLQLTFPLR